jgi:hypothetical protein
MKRPSFSIEKKEKPFTIKPAASQKKDARTNFQICEITRAALCHQHGSRSGGSQRTDRILSTSQSDLNIGD